MHKHTILLWAANFSMHKNVFPIEQGWILITPFLYYSLSSNKKLFGLVLRWAWLLWWWEASSRSYGMSKLDWWHHTQNEWWIPCGPHYARKAYQWRVQTVISDAEKTRHCSCVCDKSKSLIMVSSDVCSQNASLIMVSWVTRVAKTRHW
jgi:hypothetical protein